MEVAAAVRQRALLYDIPLARGRGFDAEDLEEG